MSKEMKINLNPFSTLHRSNKSVALFLLIGLAFRFPVSDSFRFSPVTETPPALVRTRPEVPQVLSNPQALPPGSADLQANENITGQTDKCDIFTGDWLPDPSGPVYTNTTCRFIEDTDNCLRNGRPDLTYLYWRWKPRDCDLPRFNPGRFLDLVTNKSWAFIGDSIMENHVQSLLCILSQVDRAVEIYHDKEYQSKTWRFPSHNFTLFFVWSPLLLKAEIFEDSEGISSSPIQLHLDQLDKKWTDGYKNFDYVIIAGGTWFLKTAIYHENNTVVGCHNCQGKNIAELGFTYAYRKALKLVLDFTTKPAHKALVLLRTTVPDHFENGEWSSGGTCNRTMPFKEGEVELKDADSTMREIELDEFENAKAGVGQNGVVLRLLDTTMMSAYRPDGHPGPYRSFHPFAGDKNAKVQNDCLHWCLPGPIDYWNDLMMEVMMDHLGDLLSFVRSDQKSETL